MDKEIDGADYLSPLWERKDFLGFSRFAKSLENPREGILMVRFPLSPRKGEIIGAQFCILQS
ncbi:hypothetical protein N8E89_12245 [Phyllobacterium sp. A18/5-2]|uniref:hypothetical protein n=1 Tax=Phyllobacterium sp. A18/5-2 TaxID=2978392 RepID=UPI0021CA79D4|nr:hypothetical protein [Phyllobacterium sp. A18/5-2]UXN63380.1 hypothetical protein N8E89_12245 [Phyllobacterium sp. A18/5-2]